MLPVLSPCSHVVWFYPITIGTISQTPPSSSLGIFCTLNLLNSIRHAFQAIALIAEGFLFIYLGMAGFMYADDESWSFGLILYMILGIIVSRIIVVFVGGFIVKYYRSQDVNNLP